jgi:23S rRNA (cytidine1920-2'-O)/16S rRNA (cytidine1409-2'-O)-methyltransferase
MGIKKQRLDELLVEQGIFPTTDAVLRAVIAREVRVDDVYVQSAAIKVSPEAEIYIKHGKNFVSRGGYKLQGALDAFEVNVKGLRCIDIGSSTGGFTDCLLKADAAEVTCVDVNYGQLAWQIRNSPKVKVFERTNIRLVKPESLGAPFDVLVCDLSFIGMASLAPVFASLSKVGSIFLGLIKPQFESKQGETDGGIVVEESVRKRVVEEVQEALTEEGFCVQGIVESPIKGTSGNIEYLIYAIYAAE